MIVFSRYGLASDKVRATPCLSAGAQSLWLVPRPTPLAHAMQGVLISLALGSGLALSSGQANAQALSTSTSASATAPTQQDYSIPAGALADVLVRFAREAGINLSYDATLLDGRSSAGLSGRHDADSGLATVLAGTGVEAQARAGGGYMLRAARVLSATGTPVSELSPIRVAGVGGGRTEGTGSYTQLGPSRTATGLSLTLRETPQSVTVMTRQRMDDQGLESLGDVVRATPGMAVTKWGGERYRFTSRGFQINNLMVDGIPIEYEEAALSTGAMSMYDSVEVMRGTAGMMEGAGTPGGSINLMRKRPTREFQGSLTGHVGSWDNYLGSLDIGGPLNEVGTLRGRAVVSYQDKRSFIDDYTNKRTLVYGILEADLTPATTATLGYYHSNEDNPGVDWNGIGTWPDGSFLPISRSTRMSPSWSYWDKKSNAVFADLEYRFNNGWKAKLAAVSIDSKMDMKGTFLTNPNVDASGNPWFTLRGGAYNYDRTQTSLGAQLTGPFTAWGRSHEVLLGASHRRSKWRDIGGGGTVNGSFDLAAFNPLHWNPHGISLPRFGEYGLWKREADTDQSGIYGMTRLSITDSIKAILGGRLDWYESDQIQYDGDWPYGGTSSEIAREFTPYVGIIYDLDAAHSVYASWTRIFNPQSYYTASGSLLDPQTGSNYELGIKGEYFGGRLNVSAAVFQIDLENLPDALDLSQCAAGLTGCYRSAGEVRSRGIELELAGELSQGWQLSASYTYASAKRLSEASDYDPIGSYSIGKRYATNIPRNMFKLATTYQLPGELSRWKVGGSLHIQDGIESPWGVKQGGYAVVGLYVGYDVNKQLSLSFNANNLFDRKYYATIGSYSDSNFFGDPGNFLLTAKYRF